MESHSPERIFAVDMMKCVMSLTSQLYVPSGYFSRAGLYSDTPFKKNIRKAVLLLVGRTARKSLNMYLYMLRVAPTDPNRFLGMITNLSVHEKMLHFDHLVFLEYCVLVCMLATHCVEDGFRGAPNIGVENIIHTITVYKRTGEFPMGTWDSLEEAAKGIINYQCVF